MIKMQDGVAEMMEKQMEMNFLREMRKESIGDTRIF